MSNLIPQKRADKNGRMVTRHVKPLTTPSSPPSIPAPTNDSVWAGGGITIPSGVSSVQDIWNKNRISRTQYTLADFDPDAVKEINRLIEESKKLDRSFGLNLAIGQALDLMATDGIKSGLHNVAVFGPCVIRHANNDVTPFITALHELYAPREIDFYLEATDKERLSATALVEFTVRAEMELGESVVKYSSEDDEEILEYTELRDPKLTTFILENPEKADDVFDILLQDKGAVPVDVIQERLQHTEKTLRNGVL